MSKERTTLQSQKSRKKKNIKTNQEKSINISKHLIRSDRHHDVVVKKKITKKNNQTEFFFKKSSKPNRNRFKPTGFSSIRFFKIKTGFFPVRLGFSGSRLKKPNRTDRFFQNFNRFFFTV